MIEHPKKLRKIYMVSSAVFSAATCAYGWMAPFGAVLGLAVNLTEDSKKSNIEEFDNAVESALARTRESMTSDAKCKILDELSKMVVEPDSLSELIEKTEAYQINYCTELDVKEIINVFDMFFRDEISKRPHLSNLYVLSTGFVTLEKLKLMNDILIKDDKKLDNIQNEVSSINKIFIEARKICVRCLNSIAFILIAMAVFLGTGIFLFHTYDRMMMTVAPICYGVSEFLVFFLSREGYVFMSMREGIAKKYYMKIGERAWKIVITFIIPIILTVSCFWIIYCAIDIREENVLISTIGLVGGNIVSTLLKETKFEQKEAVKYFGSLSS